MSDRSYRHIVKFATSTPWMMIPETLELVCEVLTARISGDRWSDAEIAARIEAAGGRRRSSNVSPAGGVAVIPLMGVIVPRANLMTDLSGGTSVTDFMQSFMAAVADPDVGAIVLDVDSPGGSVDLIPESAARIRAARGSKPILAVSDTMMASAAYYLGSQADEVYVTPSGLIGSIGVYATHYDQSGLNEKVGVKPTLVSAGKYKTELNPTEAPSEEGIAHLQSIVDDAYQQFTLDVAKGRGASVADVRGGYGEGRVLTAKMGVREHLADGVKTREETIARAGELALASSGRSRGASVAFAAELDRAAAAEIERGAGPIAPHKTATTDGPWDGPKNKANLRNDGTEDYYRSAYAWQDPDGDATTKAAYKFIHHEVSDAGDVGAANTNGCSQGIAVLNGGRGGTTIPSGDRQGVYDHLAKHIRDAGKEAPPLKGLDDVEADSKNEPDAIGSAEAASIADRLTSVLCAVDDLVAQGRPLTAAKRAQLEAIGDRIGELVDDAPVAAVGSAITEDDEAFWAGLVPTNHREE
jgi:capsid assembly protease